MLLEQLMESGPFNGHGLDVLLGHHAGSSDSVFEERHFSADIAFGNLGELHAACRLNESLASYDEEQLPGTDAGLNNYFVFSES